MILTEEEVHRHWLDGTAERSLCDSHEELRRDRDEWRTQHENALACWRAESAMWADKVETARARVAALEACLREARDVVDEIGYLNDTILVARADALLAEKWETR